MSKVDLNKVKTKRDIDAIPKITLYWDYKCRVSNYMFTICPVQANGEIFYSAYNTECTLEEVIEHTYNISVDKLYSLSSVENKGTTVLRDYYGRQYRAIIFTNKSDTIDYLIRVLRHLMTLCVNIEVDDWDDDMLTNLKKYGLTIAPYGNKSLLSPDTTQFENNTYNYEESVDDYNSCLNITIKKKKTLKFDFHE